MQPETGYAKSPTAGFERAREHPLWQALFSRRTRRVSRGASFESDSFTYRSRHEPQPLSPLEEAMLVASVGVSGIAIPDNPYRSEAGKPLAGTVLLRSTGVTAPSPDNAHATHWFFWNDEGVYRVKHPDEAEAPADVASLGPEDLVAYVERLKVRIRPGRLTFPHRFPAELHRNRFSSNVPGSTMFVPVLDLTEQYINGLLLAFSQEDGMRPVFYDDFNFYRRCGLGRWVRNGYLSREVPLPLSIYGKSITEFESLFLMQNLALTAEALGLGGWVHWAPPAPILLGGTPLSEGLGFRFEAPAFRANGALRAAAKPAVRLRRKLLPYPAGMAHPVGLDGHIEAFCPPYYESVDAAIDAVLAKKFSPGGIYKDPQFFGRILKPDFLPRFLEEVPPYPEEAVECVRALCNYVYDTYGRFPAHAPAIHAPPTWFQAHHVDTDFYDTFYDGAYSSAAAEHQRLWHGEE